MPSEEVNLKIKTTMQTQGTDKIHQSDKQESSTISTPATFRENIVRKIPLVINFEKYDR